MSKWAENKAEKRRRIDNAGLTELLDAGYGGATVERIVAGAAVARGTFYLYYPDKHALFAELVSRLYTPLVASLTSARDRLAAGDDPPTVYHRLGTDLAGLVNGYPGGARLALREARSAGPGGDLVREWGAKADALTQAILHDAVERGLLRPHDTRAVALAITGGVERLAWAWLTAESPLDPAAVTSELIFLFTFGLAAR